MLKRWLVSAAGVWLGSNLIEGISYEDNVSLAIAVLLLGLFTAVLKPLLVLMALPFVLLTLGLGVLVINALLYLLVGSLVPGFTVESFWAAFFGALVISILNVLFAGWIGGGRAGSVRVRMNRGRVGKRPNGAPPRPPREVKAKDDVIDI